MERAPKRVYLIRHAQSELNSALATVNREDRDAMRNIRYGPTYMDAVLTEHGRHQANELCGEVHALPIKKVFVSPLRRALETAHILFNEHPQRPQVYVLPLIAEQIKSAHGISQGEHKDLYPHFCWDLMPPHSFMLDNLDEEHAAVLRDADPSLPFHLHTLKHLNDIYPSGLESNRGMRMRVKRTIAMLKSELPQVEGSVALISHSCFSKDLVNAVNGRGSASKIHNCQVTLLNLKGV
mmetsp:Transcript_11366/g.22321  ORF Transcript_11366/g.22321 Transcript_11366/m.22321 type:complete len:238 (+) Transcript_11366:238-951(+)